MRQRLRFFIVVLLLMFAKENFSQELFNERIINGDIVVPFDLNRPKVILISPIFENYVSTEISVEKFLKTRKLIQKENNKHTGRIHPISFCSIEDIPKGKYFTLVTSSSLYFNLHKIPSYKPIALLCIFEDKLEKQTLIPLRLRLGSLDYTNYLEQKPNALKPSY